MLTRRHFQRRPHVVLALTYDKNTSHIMTIFALDSRISLGQLDVGNNKICIYLGFYHAQHLLFLYADPRF